MKGHGLISAAFVLVAVAAAQTHLGAAAAAKPGTVITYPTPSIYGVSATYALKANGKAVPVVEFAKQYDYAVFSLDGGPCTLEVTRLDGTPVKKHEISPEKLSLAGSASGATLSFTIAGPEYLIVAIDEPRKLVVAVDPPERDKPASSGAGIYNVTAEPYGADPTGAAPATLAI